MLHSLDNDLQGNGVNVKQKYYLYRSYLSIPDHGNQLSLGSLLGTKYYTKGAVAVVMNNEMYV